MISILIGSVLSFISESILRVFPTIFETCSPKQPEIKSYNQIISCTFLIKTILPNDSSLFHRGVASQ